MSEFNGNGKHELFEEMVKIGGHAPEDLLPERPSTTTPIPELPAAVQYDPALAAKASVWLDEYIAYSRRWSPRAHDDFHESVGLWMLSTVCARRVCLNMGRKRYPSLYIALAARTSVFAKSTTAEIAQEVLREAGLSFLLAKDDSTPQAFIRSMAYRTPVDWDEMATEQKDAFKKKVAFAAQNGWFYDEFGQKVSSMMRENGTMADFRGLLRVFDDGKDLYEYETISRGNDIVHFPYLALLANLTPADLAPYAKRNAALWNDGFWARFAFVTPPLYAERKNGRFPQEDRVVPQSLSRPLRQWHERLGVPAVDVTERELGNGKTKQELFVAPPPLNQCILGKGVYEAFYAYNDALIDVVTQSDLTDLDGNYSRLPEKALRVAMLLASLENDNRIEMVHWARAQQVAEVWRRNLHNLYDQVASPAEESKVVAMEDRLMRYIAQKGPRTARELCQGVYGLDSNQVKILTTSMVGAGLLNTRKRGRADEYLLAVQPESVDV